MVNQIGDGGTVIAEGGVSGTPKVVLGDRGVEIDESFVCQF